MRDAGAEFGVDPALLFAIAETESHFNPRATSPAGAVGMMQIMPATGEWVARRLGISEYDPSDLYDVDLNLRFAAYYLSYLSTIFVEEWQILAAYNAGEGAVRSWMNEGITADSIPYPETARYVVKVLLAIKKYSK